MKLFMAVISKIVAAVLFVEKAVPAICVGLLAIQITAITVMRYVFSYSLLGFEEFTAILGLYLYFVGSALASRLNKQVRVNIIDSISIPPRARQIIDLVIVLAAFVVCAAFSYFALDYTVWTMERHVTIDPLGWPRAVIGFSLVIGLILMSIHELYRFVVKLRQQLPARKGV
jgi:TRAP-type C4-dicarboxylate transport system permease small subunit